MNRSPSRQGLAHTRIAVALCTSMGMAAVGGLPLFLIAFLLPPATVLPVVSVVYLMAAGLLALIAWVVGCAHNSNNMTVWDLSGACAFLGFAAGILSNPEDVITAFAVGGG